jgi:hypothetical protein
MKGRRVDTEKARDENEEVEHLEMELNDFPGNWGGIVACECPAQLHSMSSMRRSKSLGGS